MDRSEHQPERFEISDLKFEMRVIFAAYLALCGVAWAAGEPNAASAPAVTWLPTYAAGVDVASAQKRPVLIKFGATWCSWCRKLDEEVLTQPAVVAQLQQFVCISVDADKEQNVAMAFGVSSLPRLLVINMHDEIVGDWLGFRSADDLLKLLRDIEPYITMETGATKRPTVLPSAPVPQAGTTRPSPVLPNDPNGLMGFLGHQEPAIRQKVIDALVKIGRPMTPLLVQALDNDYLGVRIAACKALRAITGREIDFDPWAPRPERAQSVQTLAQQLAPAFFKRAVPTNTPGGQP
jgi:thiol-disulfide isomerase/thioredoxin